MGLLHRSNVGIQVNPPLKEGSQIGIVISPSPLSLQGMNFPVTISTARMDAENPGFDKAQFASITVMAHLDTGATKTSIDMNLARHLKLASTGTSNSHTAGGLKTFPNFAIDLSFPNTNLAPFTNLAISSCTLPFNINGDMNAPRNFGILIGRDVLSRWNVVWNGPTSTVFIND